MGGGGVWVVEVVVAAVGVVVVCVQEGLGTQGQ